VCACTPRTRKGSGESGDLTAASSIIANTFWSMVLRSRAARPIRARPREISTDGWRAQNLAAVSGGTVAKAVTAALRTTCTASSRATTTTIRRRTIKPPPPRRCAGVGLLGRGFRRRFVVALRDHQDLGALHLALPVAVLRAVTIAVTVTVA